MELTISQRPIGAGILILPGGEVVIEDDSASLTIKNKSETVDLFYRLDA